MITRNRVAKARYDVALAAARRWHAHQDQRTENKRDVAVGGEGAADSTARNERYDEREQMRGVAIGLSQRGLLPQALERRIGPTLDMGFYAPSEQARKRGRPVARITRMPELGIQPDAIATGFMVSPELLLTNHHVTATASDAAGLGANFLYEYGDTGLANGRYYALDPDAFFHSDEYLDFALIAVKRSSLTGESLDDIGFVPLIEATPKILVGQAVNIIQHPDGRAKSYAVTQNRLVEILDEGFLHYETDTLGGSSGSPAFNKQWELVALHHSGVPLLRDGKVMTRTGAEWDPENMSDDDVDWIANEGIRVSTIVGALRKLRLEDTPQQKLLDGLIENTADPLQAVERMVKQGGPAAAISAAQASVDTPAGGPTMANYVLNFSGPVTINLGGGAVSVTTADGAQLFAGIAADTPSALEKKQNFDKNYATRKGYQRNFLGLDLPAPTVDAARMGEMYRDADGEVVVLPYHHFSLAMNATRRMCMWTASNMDYSADKRDDRPRKALGGEDWQPDPRIPAPLQIVDADFYLPATAIDRGHIVRREDNCWGETDLDREYANADTYHWTNCTPQATAFNQENPSGERYRGLGLKGIWGALESYLQKQLKPVGNRATLFAGPVLDNQRDPNRDFGRGGVQYPMQFWKVVVVVREEGGVSTPYAYGFILDQGDVLARFGLERIDVGRFAANQHPISEIEALAGVRFDPAIHQADVMRGQAGGTPLDSAEDVVHASAAGTKRR